MNKRNTLYESLHVGLVRLWIGETMRRLVGVWIAVILVGSGAASVASAASAAVWGIQPIPAPSVANGQLSAVSCPSSTACTAVGNYTSSSASVVLAEGWTGTSWSIQPTLNPAGAVSSSLGSVSCSSSTACIAVGFYYNSSGTFATLAERWDGTSWSILTTPKPAGAVSSSLNGVSCSSSTACTAVGYYIDSTRTFVTLAEGWDGTSWSIQTTPNPAGAKASHLSGVSCPSTTACTTVGYSTNSSGTDVTLAEGWDGTSWSIQTTPNRALATSSHLGGVSCPSSAACTGIGYNTNSSGTNVTLAERWNGTRWSIKPIPNPAGATLSAFSGVSCPSSTACTTVGYSYDASGRQVTLAERWDGTSWSIQATPNPFGAKGSVLSGVSCPSSTACTAFGNYTNRSGTDVTLVEGWDGTRWSIQTTPNPAGALHSYLSGVSCLSSTACAAVGYYLNSSGTFVTLAEGWNGKRWSIQTTPNPAGALSSSLSGVSCPSSAACTAAGNYTTSSGTEVTLAERWDGTSWSIQTTPSPAGATGSFLSGMSCPSSTACTGVGSYTKSSGTDVTLAERWDGTSWSIQTTPNPAGATLSVLGGVSCPSSTACTAVGYYTNRSGTVTLAEGWDGASWSIQTTPNPAGATLSVLSGVSCTSSTACTAVGNDSLGAATVPLADRYA